MLALRAECGPRLAGIPRRTPIGMKSARVTPNLTYDVRASSCVRRPHCTPHEVSINLDDQPYGITAPPNSEATLHTSPVVAPISPRPPNGMDAPLPLRRQLRQSGSLVLPLSR